MDFSSRLCVESLLWLGEDSCNWHLPLTPVSERYSESNIGNSRCLLVAESWKKNPGKLTGSRLQNYILSCSHATLGDLCRRVVVEIRMASTPSMAVREYGRAN